jgi:hypothetical protein
MGSMIKLKTLLTEDTFSKLVDGLKKSKIKSTVKLRKNGKFIIELGVRHSDGIYNSTMSVVNGLNIKKDDIIIGGEYSPNDVTKTIEILGGFKSH